MREISSDQIIEAIKGMCGQANYQLAEDVEKALYNAEHTEVGTLGKEIMRDIIKNLEIAKDKQVPICQDTGTAVVFVKIGQEVHITGGSLKEAIHEGVRQGYKEHYLRKSIVSCPIARKNTGDNTPAIIHFDIVEGEAFSLTLAPKGGGSENMSKVYMLSPSAGVEGIKTCVLEAAKLAGPNACLPMILGVGIGGNFEQVTLLAKQALVRDIRIENPEAEIQKLEAELLEEVNKLGLGPQGLGGKVTALAVNIETAPCHIASMPLAINIGCHVNRHITMDL